MTIYLCTFKPKKSAENNGAQILVTAVESVNAKRAESRADVLLEDNYPDAVDNFFKVIVTEVPEGVEAPEIGTFDNTFHERYELNGNLWSPIADEEAEEEKKHTFSSDQSLDVKIAAACLFGAVSTMLTSEQLRQVHDTINDPKNNHEIDTIIRALMGIESLKHAYPEKIINLVDAINDKFSDSDKFPSFVTIRNFAESWISTPPTQRAEKFESKPATSDIEIRKYSDIDMDIALAVINANIENPDVITVNRARNIIKENTDEQFKRISMSLHTVEGIKTCSREEIYSLTRELIDNELYTDKLAMSTFIADWSVISIVNSPVPVEVANLGGGKFAVSGLTGDNNAVQEVAVNIDTNGASDKEIVSAIKSTLYDELSVEYKTNTDHAGDIGYHITAGNVVEIENDFVAEELAQQDEQKLDEKEKHEAIKIDDFVVRAAVIEKEISDKPDNELGNLCIWRKVQSTDPRYTKPLEGAGFNGTSINSEYMFMRATEIFGPIGIGWGFEIIDDKIIDGAPITESVFENGKYVRSTLVRDADGSLVLEKNHSIKIRFWYLMDNEVKREFESYGATPYLYRTSKGKFIADAEVMKKSLTDAIKKALSMLGFSADIYLGWYDTPEYIEDNKTEHAIKNASDKAEDVTRLRKDLDDRFSRVAETIKTSVTVNELTKVYGVLARELETHRKSAHEKGDKDYEKYLSSRLRRLSELKEERLAILSKDEEKSA